MSFHIDATQLITDGLKLELAGERGLTRIELGPSGGLTGRYEQDAERFALRQISAKSFVLNRVELPLSPGSLAITGPSSLSELSADCEIPRTDAGVFHGSAALANATLHVRFEQRAAEAERAPLELQATLELGKTSAVQTDRRDLTAELASAELRDVRATLHGNQLRVGRLQLSGLRLSRSAQGSLDLHCESAQADEIVLERDALSLELDQLRLPGGLQLKDGTLALPELEVGRVRASLPALGQPSSAPPAPAPARRRGLPDLPLLDHLRGRLHVDVTLDVSLPIIKSRRATHAFRVPIEDGTIDFKQLERGLAGVEDAVLDFEVTSDALILERDLIPGVTFDNQTLVSWPLEGAELELAKRENRVRLRRLLEYRIDPSLQSKSAGQDRAADSASPLRRLDVDFVDVTLALGGPSVLELPALGTLRLGSAEQPAVESLTLGGRIQHAAAETLPATELSLKAAGLLVAGSFPALAGRRLELGALGVHRIDSARLRLQGFKPESASLDVEGVRLERVELRGPG